MDFTCPKCKGENVDFDRDEHGHQIFICNDCEEEFEIGG